MFSAFFIRRPIFASVLSIVIFLAGAAAMFSLPVEQYPEIVPPTVTVTANYPGASADVIAQTVAAPLEQAINGVDNMLYVQSASASSGKLNITVSFKIGTNADQATINVNNKVQSALTQLPEEVRRQGVLVEKKSTAFLQIISLSSPSDRFDSLYMSNYALLNVIDELKRIPGVGSVVNFAGQDYSMRVWLKPDRLAQLKLSPSDIAAAIREQNAQFAAGKFGAEPTAQRADFTYTVTTQGRLSTPEEFENIIVRANADGSKIHLRDVARVELGALMYDFAGEHNGKASIPLGIYLAPGANQVSTAQAVQAEMARLSKRFPEGLVYSIPFDTTRFVDASVNEVKTTLLEAMVLVFAVVYLFLQNWRATLIPCLAVPVSIVGTFAGMYLLGFSINTLTLFGMVLAIGIVVDDAIVVLENVERIMSQDKLPPMEATLKAMDEVSGPVVAIVLVLCAVFIPVAFLGGIAGQMYKQFAITIAVSVVISGLVALTLTPALCALLLKPTHSQPNRFFQAFNGWFDRQTNRYGEGVRFLLKRSSVGFLLFAAMIVVTVGLFKQVPSSLAPDEDQGYLLAAVILPDASSIKRTHAAMQQLDGVSRKEPIVSDVMSFTGFDILSGGNKTSSGASFIITKLWGERKGADESTQSLVGRIFGKGGAAVKDGFVMAFNPPPISGMSNTGGFEAYIQNRGEGDDKALAAMTQKMVAAAAKRPELAGVQTTFSANVPQRFVKLDREKAKTLGVPINTVFDAMQSTFGALYVNDFNLYGRTFRVQLQSEAEFRAKAEDIRNVYVPASKGNMVPLSSLVSVSETTGPEILERFNVFPAAKLVGGPAPGYSSGQSLAALEAVAKETLGEDYTLAWTGSAFQEQSTSGSSAMVFIFGMIMVFLILSAQYERWSLPLAVLMAVPFAVFGALLANWLRGLENDVYFQVALVTLIGLASKNAILIVEFAVLKMEEGVSLFDAAMEAAKLRFRPIVMTSLAFVLGCVPLAISSGAGAASRHSIGTGVIGGMLAATFIAVFFIPMFFMVIMQFSQRGKKAAAAQLAPKEGQ